MQNRSECGFVEAASRRHGIITSKPPLARLRALYALMRFRTWALRTLNHAKPRQARFCWGRSTAPRYNDLDIAACALSRMNASEQGMIEWDAALPRLGGRRCVPSSCAFAQRRRPCGRLNIRLGTERRILTRGRTGGCQYCARRGTGDAARHRGEKGAGNRGIPRGERTVPRGGRTGTGKRHLGAHRRRHAGVCPGFLSRGSTAARCRLKGPCVYLKGSFLWNSRIRGRYSSTGS